MLDLSGMGDITLEIESGKSDEPGSRRERYEIEIGLLGDIGWMRKDERECFPLTTSPAPLSRLLSAFHERSLQALALLALGASEEEAGSAEEHASTLRTYRDLLVRVADSCAQQATQTTEVSLDEPPSRPS